MNQVSEYKATATITTENVCCDQCHSKQAEPLYVGRDYQHHLPGEWTIVRCQECGLCYTNPRPDLKSLGLIYPEDYIPYQAKTRKKKSRRWQLQQWVLQNHWNYPPHRSNLVSKLSSWPMLVWFKGKIRHDGLVPWEGQGRLLDYGCGSGGYMYQMQQRGWEVIGMDMSEEALNVCREQGLKVHQGIDPTKVFEPNSFDVVSLWHVIEHVPSPTETLGQMNSILKPGGKLVLVMPNINSTLARRYGPYWFPMELPRHFTHFDRSSLRKILTKSGFQVETIRGQKHGRVFQKTMQYLGQEKKGFYQWLGRQKKLCSLIEHLTDFWGEPSVLMVQARKANED